MRLQIFSDIHCEAQVDAGDSFVASQDRDACDVAILAGDIATPRVLLQVLKLFCKKFKDVIFIHGNHELWGTGRESFAKLMVTALKNNKNLRWLQNEVLELEGMRFLGTTLWFPEDPLNPLYSGFYGDFQRIHRFREWVYSENQKAQTFLQREMRAGDVVISHMAPSEQSISEIFRTSKLNRFYVTPMDDLILERAPALWVHGHMHQSFDYQIGETRVVCNPFGYASLGMINPTYEERKIVTI